MYEFINSIFWVFKYSDLEENKFEKKEPFEEDLNMTLLVLNTSLKVFNNSTSFFLNEYISNELSPLYINKIKYCLTK